MAQLRITDSSGTEKDTIGFSQFKLVQNGLNIDAEGLATISRDDLNSLSLVSGEDRVFLEDPNGTDRWGGILRTPGRNGGQATLKIDSFARYMERAQPVALGQEKTSVDDSTLVSEAVDATPQLSKGTINTITTGETYIFSGVTQRSKARKVAEIAEGELVFNADLSVDYVNTRGSDKTGTTLSPSNGSFAENTFTVDRDGRSGNTTHLKVYSVGQGSHQQVATIVPDTDSASYENKATYSHPSWSGGDDKIWDSFTNKDLKNVSALQTWGKKLANEVESEEISVETVVKGEDVRLGDEYHIKFPEENIDANLRATKLTTIWDAKGPRYQVRFSNYSEAHFNEVAEDHKDTDRYNLEFEGDLVQLTQSPGRGPVDSTHDYVFDVFYPDDVRHEVDAQILVKGLQYRAYSQGAAAGGDHTHSVDVTHPSHSHNVDVTHPQHSHLVAVTHPEHNHSVSTTSDQKSYSGSYTSSDKELAGSTGANDPTATFSSVGTDEDVWVTVTGTVGSGADPIAVTVSIHDGSSTGATQIDSTTFSRSSGSSFAPTVAAGFDDRSSTDLTVEVTAIDQNFDTVPVENTDASLTGVPGHTHGVSDTSTNELGTTIDETSDTALGTTNSETSDAELGTTQSETSDASGDHTHSPQSGIVDFGSDFPSNVDVVVNNNSQGTSLGGGASEFEATVDVSGALSSGWNTIALTSDTLGHLDATFSADLFRQSL